MVVEAETNRHTVDVEEVHKLGNTVGGCTRPLVSLFPYNGFGFLSTGCCHFHGRFL